MLFLPARSALLVLFFTAKALCADPIYKKVGDSVVLNPGQFFYPISSVIWKQELDLALEWDGPNVICYRDFKDRCSLNKKHGSFTISNLKVEDSGIYTPQINNKVLKKLELRVIEPVPKPTVSVKCNNEKTLCYLTCEGNVSADVGTVTYRWRNGEVVLSNNKELIITTENKESSFICELENPVSNSSSDGVDNPLSRVSENPGAAAGLAVIFVGLIAAAVLAVVGRFVYYWCKKGSWDKKKAKGQYASVSTQDTNIKKNHEPNGGGPADTVQNVNEKDGEAPSRDNEEKDGSGEEDKPFYQASDKLTSGPTDDEAPPGDNKEKDGSEPKINNHEPNVGQSTPTVHNTSENEAKTSPSNNKEKDDPDQKPAEESSSENQVDSNTGEQPFNGTENTSVEPIGPETSEQGSAVQDQS